MASFFDTVFGAFADSLSCGFSDDVKVIYRDEDRELSVDAIIRTIDTKEVISEETQGEVSTVEIVIRKCDSFWTGISDPRLTGQFEFFGSIWEQMVLDSAGINAESRTFATLTVRRVGIRSLGHPDRIREPTT